LRLVSAICKRADYAFLQDEARACKFSVLEISNVSAKLDAQTDWRNSPG
jgi:hypothetical protein